MFVFLGACLLGNLLTGKGIVRAGSGKKKEKGNVRAGTGRPISSALSKKKKKMIFLMPAHPLTNFEIQKYHKNGPRFNGIFLRINLLKKKIKDRAYVINPNNMQM